MADEVALKDTVLTPKTDFPMKANLTTREKETLARWYEKDLYGEIRRKREGAEKFILHDGPPYANGNTHTGTGMNKILKDLVVKFRTMRGFDSPYIPGWDCHGLPIENKVLEELGGMKPEDLTALDVRKRCFEMAEKYIDLQREQFKRVFVLGRWDKPYLTIDPQYEVGVLECFKELFEMGYIHRALRPVHWSWAARSALAEAELEYKDRKDPSIYVRFPITVGDELKKAAGDRKLSLVIWTTTPWTLLANTAVAVSAEAEYTLYGVGDEALLMATQLGPKALELAGITEFESLITIKGKDLMGVAYEHPFIKRDLSAHLEEYTPAWATAVPGVQPIVLADFVTLSDGTGIVHIAPGHGAEDFGLGAELNLPIICPVDEKGCYYKGQRFDEVVQVNREQQDARKLAWVEKLEGQHYLKANKIVIEGLESEGAMLFWKDEEHSYPHCWRTHQPVIFRATEQWFVRMDYKGSKAAQSMAAFNAAKGEAAPEAANAEKKKDGEALVEDTLRRQVLDQIDEVQWFPAWGKKRISGMVEGRPDWCISRQRYWGIPIPALMDPESGQVCMTKDTLEHIISLVGKEGSNVWFDDEKWPVEKLLPDDKRPEEFKGKKLEKMFDIFDVWFESGASHRSVVLKEEELHFPADLYLEGDDQHRGWFQVSMILSTATQGVSPFKQCVTNAFVVDEQGEKASKSKGNMFAIDEGCDQVGGDLMRLYFSSIDTSSPVPVTMQLMREKTSNIYRTLRNTMRVLLGNLHDYDPEQHFAAPEKLLEIDRWALSRLSSVLTEYIAAFERYEFHTATRLLVDFCNLDLSAFYVDATKDRIYCDAADSESRRSGQTTMYQLVNALARILAPICPHTADEVWSFLPGDKPWSVHLADFPAPEDYQRAEGLEKKYTEAQRVRAEVERVFDPMRKTKQLTKSAASRVRLHPGSADLRHLLETQLGAEDLATIMGVSEVTIENERPSGATDAQEVGGLAILVERSPYDRCERCWNHTDTVFSSRDLGIQVCERCNEVLRAGNVKLAASS